MLREKLYAITMPLDEFMYLHITDFLYTLEGPLSFTMNAVIYALIKEEHHDIWLEKDHKFITSFNEIFEIPLSTRLKFLNLHGFSFFSETCSRKLRNAVAHQDFNIESDGSIHYKDTTKTLSEIDRINKRMNGIVEIFMYDIIGEV